METALSIVSEPYPHTCSPAPINRERLRKLISYYHKHKGEQCDWQPIYDHALLLGHLDVVVFLGEQAHMMVTEEGDDEAMDRATNHSSYTESMAAAPFNQQEQSSSRPRHRSTDDEVGGGSAHRHFNNKCSASLADNIRWQDAYACIKHIVFQPMALLLDEECQRALLSIKNAEIRSFFITLFRDWLDEDFGEECCRHELEKEYKENEEKEKDSFQHHTPPREVSKEKKEGTYRVLSSIIILLSIPSSFPLSPFP